MKRINVGKLQAKFEKWLIQAARVGRLVRKGNIDKWREDFKFLVDNYLSGDNPNIFVSDNNKLGLSPLK